MALILAPMHGLADFLMRQTLTQIGGYDECVSEFVRITHTVHSKQIWHKYIPELNHNGTTLSGTPCTVQLLGSNLLTMPQNALNVTNLGATKIDLNFGCPAPSVNAHKGGAILLKEPELIFRIVQSVKRALPESVALSAKMRLGYENTELALECAQAIASGGADRLIVHARTKVEAYKPPAHWNWITKIKNSVEIPVVANGDIFCLKDYIEIKKQTGCEDFMIGRGALMRPDLANQIKLYEKNNHIIPEDNWSVIKQYLQQFFILCQENHPQSKYPFARLKQWLGMMQDCYPEAKELFAKIRILQNNDAIQTTLMQ